MGLEPFEGKSVVIVDFDGTLVELNVDWQVIKTQLSEEFAGIPFEKLNLGIDILKRMRDEKSWTRAMEIIRKYENERVLKIKSHDINWKLINVIKELVSDKGKKLAIFTDNLYSSIELFLENYNLSDYFSIVISRDTLNKFKPHPEGILKIMKHFRISRSDEVAMIGNSEKDMVACKNAGILFVHVNEIV